MSEATKTLNPGAQPILCLPPLLRSPHNWWPCFSLQRRARDVIISECRSQCFSVLLHVQEWLEVWAGSSFFINILRKRLRPKITVCWVMVLCRLMICYWCFGELRCFFLQDSIRRISYCWELYFLDKCVKNAYTTTGFLEKKYIMEMHLQIHLSEWASLSIFSPADSRCILVLFSGDFYNILYLRINSGSE